MVARKGGGEEKNGRENGEEKNSHWREEKNHLMRVEGPPVEVQKPS